MAERERMRHANGLRQYNGSRLGSRFSNGSADWQSATGVQANGVCACHARRMNYPRASQLPGGSTSKTSSRYARFQEGRRASHWESSGRTPLWNWETCLPAQSADMSAHSTRAGVKIDGKDRSWEVWPGVSLIWGGAAAPALPNMRGAVLGWEADGIMALGFFLRMA